MNSLPVVTVTSYVKREPDNNWVRCEGKSSQSFNEYCTLLETYIDLGISKEIIQAYVVFPNDQIVFYDRDNCCYRTAISADDAAFIIAVLSSQSV